MDSILVKGNGALNGVIPIAGAKNACLTLMPATLLTEEPLTLTNAPRLSDIRTMTQLLQSLGAEVASHGVGQVGWGWAIVGPTQECVEVELTCVVLHAPSFHHHVASVHTVSALAMLAMGPELEHLMVAEPGVAPAHCATLGVEVGVGRVWP